MTRRRRARPSPIWIGAVLAVVPVAAGLADGDATGQVEELLRRRAGAGAVLVLDVASGRVMASAGRGRDVSAPLLPLSVVKLYTAALWWNHGFGEGAFEQKEGGRVGVHDILVHGLDRPAEEMAVSLRRRIGSARVCEELHGLGLGIPPGRLSLEGVDDAAWGETLSIGERRVTVTLEQVSRFLRAIGQDGGGLMKAGTARRLQAAMRDTVSRGTASAAASAPARPGWQLGGKTGTGPAEAAPNYDGWFAGLIFDRGRPRYTVAVYVDARGPGGGVAASLAAALTGILP